MITLVASAVKKPNIGRRRETIRMCEKWSGRNRKRVKSGKTKRSKSCDSLCPRQWDDNKDSSTKSETNISRFTLERSEQAIDLHHRMIDRHA